MTTNSFAFEKSSFRSVFPNDALRGVEMRDQAVARRVAREGIVGLGETYIEGLWTANRLDDVLYAVFTSPQPRLSPLVGPNGCWLWLIKGSSIGRPESRAFNIGIRHYDLGNDLFRIMLDESMTYTCGYWAKAATLHEAQEAKLDLVCRKLDLRPGLRVLDIGCGWGNFAQYAGAAKRYGVSVTGITVSRRRAAHAARQHAKGCRSRFACRIIER